MPRFYFDLAAHRASAAKGETPWTPAVGICFGLDVALGLIEAEGWPSIFRRHAACGAAARAGLRQLGVTLFAEPAHASDTVTSAVVPEGVEWSALSKELRGRGLVIAGGQGSLTGKIFRVGHLGAVTVDDIVAAMGILEDGLRALGVTVPGGAAAAALEAGRQVEASGRTNGATEPAAAGVA
jgi:aspartate aminotransferase-like enzyme